MQEVYPLKVANNLQALIKSKGKSFNVRILAMYYNNMKF